MTRINGYLVAIRNLGLLNALRNAIRKGLHKSRERALFSSKHLRYPVFYRPGTSDIVVFYQIFIEREYSCFDDLADVG
jgi:hypothetical protein